jgi:hypothetical protein
MKEYCMLLVEFEPAVIVSADYYVMCAVVSNAWVRLIDVN